MSEHKKTLTEQLLWLGTLLTRERDRNKMGHRRGYRRGQNRILAFLKIQPEVTVKELAYVLDIPREMLLAILKQMEEDGRVELKTADDGSGIETVRLTEEGATDSRPHAEQIFDCLSDEEKETFSECMRKLTESLEEKLNYSSEEAGDESGKEENSDEDSDFAVRFNWKVRGSDRHGGKHGGKHGRAWIGKDIVFHGKLPNFPPFPFRSHFYDL